MAKDVDLSSQEWLDIVFEKKNKEFGAYDMRRKSKGRHTRALIITLIILAAALIIAWLAVKGFIMNKEDENLLANTEQQAVAQAQTDEDIDEELLDMPPMLEEETPPPPQEEIVEEVAQQMFTEVEVTKEEVKNEIKNQQDMKDDKSDISTQNIEGTDDLSKIADVKSVTEVAPVAPVQEKPKEEVYSMATVEQKPSFPGGDQALFKWLGDNIIYPQAAAEENVSGKVTVQFVVNKDGSISGVRVVRGKHPALDKEAERVVKKMPKWNPGRNNGQPVRVTYLLPINFQLK
ncbi:MAG: energy transducer TonB [Muribaculaceae bacterium]|nr:energy transducer TonB [Muribaculaceae bacterium]